MRALITGVTGQDGYFLSQLLIEKGYEVFGLVRRSSQPRELPPGVEAVCGDMTDTESLRAALSESTPDEIYNLAAQSHVAVSHSVPSYTFRVNAEGALNLFEVCRQMPWEIRLYQAGTSEQFGGSLDPLNEQSAFHPRSPYAIAKVAAHHAAVHYREAYGMHISNGILFNHESERRGEEFVTRKITRAVARIRCGLQSKLTLGHLAARRDWGYAGDYVEAMWKMLQQPQGSDYVIGTGQTSSVEQFARCACDLAGIKFEDVIEEDATLKRPNEVWNLRADFDKARVELQWEPTKNLRWLIERMVQHDISLARRECDRADSQT